jgi:hypothetical protein
MNQHAINSLHRTLIDRQKKLYDNKRNEKHDLEHIEEMKQLNILYEEEISDLEKAISFLQSLDEASNNVTG